MSGSDKRPVLQAEPGTHADGGYGPDGGSLSYAATGGNPTTGDGGSPTTGAVTVSASTLVLSAGELSGNAIELADRGQFDFTGGRLMVKAFVGTLIQDGGSLEPGGPSSGETTVHGDYYLGSEGTLRMQLLGTAPEAGYDQLTVNGSVVINGGNLDIVLGFEPKAGDSFTIIKAVGEGPVEGTFAGLAEGTTFSTTFGDKTVPMVITYGPPVTVRVADHVPSDVDVAELIAASEAMGKSAASDSTGGAGQLPPTDPFDGFPLGDTMDVASADENYSDVAPGLLGPNHQNLTDPNLGQQTGDEQPSAADAPSDSTGDSDGDSGDAYGISFGDLLASAQADNVSSDGTQASESSEWQPGASVTAGSTAIATTAASDSTVGSGGSSGDGDEFAFGDANGPAQADNTFFYGDETTGSGLADSAALVDQGGETSTSLVLATEPEQASVPAAAPDLELDLASSVPLVGLQDGLQDGSHVVFTGGGDMV
jgi:hypothetical protein